MAPAGAECRWISSNVADTALSFNGD